MSLFGNSKAPRRRFFAEMTKALSCDKLARRLTPLTSQAVDEDAESPNNVVEYCIMSADPNDAFEMDARTGEIQLKPYIKSMEIVRNITMQKDCKWSLVVQARDRGSPSFSTTAVVNVDITEAVSPSAHRDAGAHLRSRQIGLTANWQVFTVSGFTFRLICTQPHVWSCVVIASPGMLTIVCFWSCVLCIVLSRSRDVLFPISWASASVR